MRERQGQRVDLHAFVVVVIFGAALAIVLHWGIVENARDIAMVMVGILAGRFGTVVDYWLGSSSSSARKTEISAGTIPPAPDRN